MHRILVTAVGGPAGLAAMRSLLDTLKYELIVTDADKLAAGLFQKGVISHTLPRADEYGYMKKLRALCVRENVDVVLPCSDEEIETVSRAGAKVGSVNVAIPPYSSLKNSVDKWLTTQSLKDRLRVPKTFAPSSLEKLEDCLSCLDYPIVLRPRVGRGARDVVYCHSYEDVVSAYDLLSSKRRGFIVQEHVPGGPGSVYVVQTLWDKNHKVVAGAVMRKLRERPATGGVATAGETIANSEILELGVNAVRGLGPWIGPAGAEFKLHKGNKRFYLMEINPRLQGVSYLFTAAGINFPDLWVSVSADRSFAPIFEYQNGLCFTRTWFDYTFVPRRAGSQLT